MGKAKRYQKGSHIYTKWGKHHKEVRKVKETPIPGPNQQQLKLNIDDETARGKYSNLGSISCTKDEFFLDFIYIAPGTQDAKVISRIITSPGHAKRFAKALNENIARFESQHGEIAP